MSENADKLDKSEKPPAQKAKKGILYRIEKFFLPSTDKKYFIRLAIVALVAFLFFKYVCIPLRIKGKSMEPTYADGGINFCWRPTYLFSQPKRGDVVILRYSGRSVMLLKRIVAFEGETVEFRNGQLYVNGEALDEPYLKGTCDWDLPVRKVGKGELYVIGDNRNVAMEVHKFGKVDKHRIVGVPLW